MLLLLFGEKVSLIHGPLHISKLLICRTQKRFCSALKQFPFQRQSTTFPHILPCTQKSVTRTPWSYPAVQAVAGHWFHLPENIIQHHLLTQHVRATHQVMQTTGKTAQERTFLAGLHCFPAVLKTAPGTLWGSTKCIWWPSQWLDNTIGKQRTNQTCRASTAPTRTPKNQQAL